LDDAECSRRGVVGNLSSRVTREIALSGKALAAGGPSVRLAEGEAQIRKAKRGSHVATQKSTFGLLSLCGGVF